MEEIDHQQVSTGRARYFPAKASPPLLFPSQNRRSADCSSAPQKTIAPSLLPVFKRYNETAPDPLALSMPPDYSTKCASACAGA